MSAIFGGIGGRADMMLWIMGGRTRRGPKEHGQGLYLPCMRRVGGQAVAVWLGTLD